MTRSSESLSERWDTTGFLGRLQAVAQIPPAAGLFFCFAKIYEQKAFQ
jgi:hypothetical protein